MIRVSVPLGERSYEVVIGRGATSELATLLPDSVRKVAIVTQEPVGVEVQSGREQFTFVVPDGEAAKTTAVVEDLCRQFARFGLRRADAVLGVGGGAVTDVAGFAASVYMRGVPVAHVATTLLAQIDAAIGGKTGVDLPEGKNLVGSFWQPVGVICDIDTLSTLPPRERRAGMGEMAKYAFLGAPDLGRLPLEEQVAACVALKADVVSSDERESGRRAVLNYGHTLAHALETAGHYDLLHGEAVGIGLCYAARLAERLGRIDAGRVDDHDRLVSGFDLPTRVPPGSAVDELITLMLRDKKVVDGLTFVLDGPNGVEAVPGVDPELAAATLIEMGATP
ncbi:MAG TPA: 3-dehydroquinate synthase family protein [Acidimicrobiales bacterium]|nr:3-dehydroquinate synthase family protein [Acidimicrobiales bacterium]